LKKDEIVFVVNPANPVGKLTWEQLRDIHTGKISNWKEVGGKDKPIVVYADSTTGGTRAMIKKIVLGGAEFGPAVKSQSSVKRAAEMVGGDEAGVAGVGKGFVDAEKNKTLDTKKIERPLALATLGAPKPAAKAVIEAFAKEAKSR
jgi:phosphate transport system substrate-binding protein